MARPNQPPKPSDLVSNAGGQPTPTISDHNLDLTPFEIGPTLAQTNHTTAFLSLAPSTIAGSSLGCASTRPHSCNSPAMGEHFETFPASEGWPKGALLAIASVE
ncbi:hypothetical protein Adt_21534 [Abeliophyllum distichum]|uniref:Uncharacterized protein n=1 Tax=Abeliophyllum distichum TaxID=126358 RepID=A0ABD1SZS9_9LAMI